MRSSFARDARPAVMCPGAGRGILGKILPLFSSPARDLIYVSHPSIGIAAFNQKACLAVDYRFRQSATIRRQRHSAGRSSFAGDQAEPFELAIGWLDIGWQPYPFRGSDPESTRPGCTHR